jgi:hypothetical protein
MDSPYCVLKFYQPACVGQGIILFEIFNYGLELCQYMIGYMTGMQVKSLVPYDKTRWEISNLQPSNELLFNSCI